MGDLRCCSIPEEQVVLALDIRCVRSYELTSPLLMFACTFGDSI